MKKQRDYCAEMTFLTILCFFFFPGVQMYISTRCKGSILSFFWERSESLEHRPSSSGASAVDLQQIFPLIPRNRPSPQVLPPNSHLTLARLGPRPSQLSSRPSTPIRQPPRATCSPSAWSRSPPLSSAVPRPARRSRGARRHFPSVFSVCLKRENPAGSDGGGLNALTLTRE